MSTILLGGREVTVEAVPLGRLKRLLPAFGRLGPAFSTGVIDEASMDDLVVVLAEATGLPVADIEQMTVRVSELVEALPIIAQTMGLVETAQGKDQPATGSTGTTSTPG